VRLRSRNKLHVEKCVKARPTTPSNKRWQVQLVDVDQQQQLEHLRVHFAENPKRPVLERIIFKGGRCVPSYRSHLSAEI
jgi:hypothetical protein